MAKTVILSFFLCIFFSQLSYSQDNNDYTIQIDTLYEPSEDYPGVLDTIIVYKKLKIVKQEYYVPYQKKERKQKQHWLLGITAGLALPFHNSPQQTINNDLNVNIETDSYETSVFIEKQLKNFNFVLNADLTFLTKKWQYSSNHYSFTEHTVNFTDTIEAIVTEGPDSTLITNYVFENRQETYFDSTLNNTIQDQKQQFTFVGLSLYTGYTIKLKQWSLMPNFGVGVYIPIKVTGTTISQEGNTIDLLKNNVQKQIPFFSFSLRTSYQLNKKWNFIFNSKLTYQNQSLYTYSQSSNSTTLIFSLGISHQI